MRSPRISSTADREVTGGVVPRTLVLGLDVESVGPFVLALQDGLRKKCHQRVSDASQKFPMREDYSQRRAKSLAFNLLRYGDTVALQKGQVDTS